MKLPALWIAAAFAAGIAVATALCEPQMPVICVLGAWIAVAVALIIARRRFCLAQPPRPRHGRLRIAHGSRSAASRSASNARRSQQITSRD